MPGKLKVRILAARDLPVMDRASDLADAFVEVRFGQATEKTEVFRKSLNPQWNTDWFKFEVDDEELQDEPLQIRVLDYDTYSAHDTIGKVYIDLNSLLWKDGVSEISGWMPIFDTMHGIRGEINVAVRVELIEDANKFRQSSCGVHFFSSTRVPTCYKVEAIHGFVEELVVNNDPEYQWIDMIRTPRASNEARQRLFSKLSGELQRKIGLKVLEVEGNAVIGYWQCFDMEGESGVVVRGIGTAATLKKSAALSPPKDVPRDSPFDDSHDAGPQLSPTVIKQPPSPTRQLPPLLQTSDPDLTTSVLASSGGSGGLSQRNKGPNLMHGPKIAMMEYPFFTITTFPPNFLAKLGGAVTARSVKLLDRIHNPDESEARDVWWTEIRTEIRAHAASMGCNAVVGYKETTSIFDEICLLSATGTAAIVNVTRIRDPQQVVLTKSLDRVEFQKEQAATTPPLNENLDVSNSTGDEFCCTLCHIPYNDAALPFPITLTSCQICRKWKVPDVLFTTIEPPAELMYTGRGCCIQARICKMKRKAQGEINASLISDALPFIEFELHRQLMNRLKVKGMNALFGLRVTITVGENVLVGTAAATAVYVTALPPPSMLRITSKDASEKGDRHLKKLQQRLVDVMERNKELYDLNSQVDAGVDAESPVPGITEEINDPQMSSLHKETHIIEVDDMEDQKSISDLLEGELPKGFYHCSTNELPGNVQLAHHLQMITMVRRANLSDANTASLNSTLTEIVQSLCFKLRTQVPCCLCKLSWDVFLSEDNIAYVWLTAAALRVREKEKSPPAGSSDTEMMFAMEEVTDGKKGKTPSPLDKKIFTKRDSFWTPSVQITPLNLIPGALVEKYLGNINIFFVRECTSVKENGGVGGFMHNFVSEVNAIVRSHVMALGGNALLAYDMVNFVLMDNPHKNQCQGLINVSGDAVHVEYENTGDFRG